jgi:hypothetical protein
MKGLKNYHVEPKKNLAFQKRTRFCHQYQQQYISNNLKITSSNARSVGYTISYHIFYKPDCMK